MHGLRYTEVTGFLPSTVHPVPWTKKIKLMSLPKILIIGQPFNNDTGGGITLSNLFSGWDSDKLAVACSGYELSNSIDTTRCDTYYQLGHKENTWLFPFSLIKRKYPSGLVTFEKQEEKIQSVTVEKSNLRVKLITNVMNPFMEYTGLIHFVTKMHLSKEFRAWLDEYQPDILYTQASSLPDISFCIAVHDYLKKPTVFHMMDDWPMVISHKGPFKRYWYKRIDSELRQLLNRCTLLLSICDHMSDEYKRRYDRDFVPFHNPIQLDFWKQYQRTTYDLDDSPRILYAGRTGLGIDSSLITVATAVQEINKRLNLSAKLVLQTGEKPQWIDQYDCVEHKNFVPYEELPRVFAEADFMLLPYDFSPKSIKYIQYSMPTKASEFMASGTPIIAFAPEETAAVQYAQKHGWAKVVTENKVEVLTKAIQELIQSKAARQGIAENAKTLAEERHAAHIVSAEFQQMIRAAAAPKAFVKEA